MNRQRQIQQHNGNQPRQQSGSETWSQQRFSHKLVLSRTCEGFLASGRVRHGADVQPTQLVSGVAGNTLASGMLSSNTTQEEVSRKGSSVIIWNNDRTGRNRWIYHGLYLANVGSSEGPTVRGRRTGNGCFHALVERHQRRLHQTTEGRLRPFGHAYTSRHLFPTIDLPTKREPIFHPLSWKIDRGLERGLPSLFFRIFLVLILVRRRRRRRRAALVVRRRRRRRRRAALVLGVSRVLGRSFTLRVAQQTTYGNVTVTYLYIGKIVQMAYLAR
jgi:hypothetical protein